MTFISTAFWNHSLYSTPRSTSGISLSVKASASAMCFNHVGFDRGSGAICNERVDSESGVWWSENRSRRRGSPKRWRSALPSLAKLSPWKSFTSLAKSYASRKRFEVNRLRAFDRGRKGCGDDSIFESVQLWRTAWFSSGRSGSIWATLARRDLLNWLSDEKDLMKRIW